MAHDATPPLLGLVLAGGRSTRMQRDKATLRYHGLSQLDWAGQLLAPHVRQVFVSVRPDQRDDPARAAWPQIADQHENAGPIAGIAAAQAAHPDAAWLVLACDLPFLDEATLQRLCAERDPSRVATAFRGSVDGLPEPLCAIYEPRSRGAIVESIVAGRNCPRKFLIGSSVKLLDPSDQHALDNVNSSEDYVAAMNALAPETATLNLRVQYFALLREQAGRSDEALRTTAHTPAELYAQLRTRYAFTLAPEMLRVAINTEFAEWSQPLADGDAVVFIPPVAGG